MNFMADLLIKIRFQFTQLLPGAYAGFHFGRGCMASAGTRAYNGGMGAVPPGGCAPSGVQGQSRAPGGDQGGEPP